MTLAIDIIASSANLRNNGEAADLLLAYELAINLSLGDDITWADLPLGAGSAIISFAKSDYYKDLPEFRTYGDVARAFLNWRWYQMTA